MTTKELIRFLKGYAIQGNDNDYKAEIIQCLLEYDELKEKLKSIVYTIADFGYIDDEGNFKEF